MTRKDWAAIVKWSRDRWVAKNKGFREAEKEAGKRYDSAWPMQHAGWLALGEVSVVQANLPEGHSMPANMAEKFDLYLQGARDFRPTKPAWLGRYQQADTDFGTVFITHKLAFCTGLSSSATSIVTYLDSRLEPCWRGCDLYVADMGQRERSPVYAVKGAAVVAIMMPTLV